MQEGKGGRGASLEAGECFSESPLRRDVYTHSNFQWKTTVHAEATGEKGKRGSWTSRAPLTQQARPGF